MMRITDLPDDCLLACLARCPYADLRNAVPSTCKQLRDAVASSAFRKLREASGWVEWGVFATARGASADACFLITESGVRRAAPRPPGQSGYFVERPQNEVIVMSGLEPMRARAYNPSENTWREIAPLVRDLDGRNYDSLDYHASLGCIGGHLVVIGGGAPGESYEAFQRRMDAYDPAQDAWSRLLDVPFTSHMNGLVEVDGKLYCFGGYQWHQGTGSQHEDARRTLVYDPATRAWTDGPRLPHEPRVNEYDLKCISAFERSKRLCIMGAFSLNDGSARFLAFVWDPTRDTWDEFPVPPVVPEYRGVSQVDGHVFVHSYGSSDQPTELPPGQRIFVLRPGSRDWTEWDIPAAVQNTISLPLFYAVRIG